MPALKESISNLACYIPPLPPVFCPVSFFFVYYYEEGEIYMKTKVEDKVLELISGGTLPIGWQKLIDDLAPSFIEQYPGITYEQALEMLRGYLNDQEDFDLVAVYIQKFFF